MSQLEQLPEAIRLEYEKLMARFTDPNRMEAFKNLRTFAEEKTQFLTTPASTKYHMSCKHGLLLHSMSVTDTLFSIRDALSSPEEISDSTVVLVAMFHDLGKVGASMNQPLYIPREPTEKQKQYGYPANPPYEFNTKILNMEHAHRSIYLITKFMSISQEEFQAIMIHDGVAMDANKSYNMKESKLALLLHYADKYSAMFLEMRNEG